jgi:hypothetical protein
MAKKHIIAVIIILFAVIAYSGFMINSKNKCEADCDAGICQKASCIHSFSGYSCEIKDKQLCCGNGVCESQAGYQETGNSCSQDCQNCDDGDACTEDSYDYSTKKCVNSPISNCCGNGMCEFGEDQLNCEEDCISKLLIQDVKIRISGGDDFTWEDYEVGEEYKLDSEESGTNIGEITATIINVGNSDIRDLKVKYECWDEDSEIYSSEICYRVPYVMDKSLCDYNFEHYYLGSQVIFEDGKNEGKEIAVLPPGEPPITFEFLIKSTQLLEVFRINHQEMYHELSCEIAFISSESGIKETVKVENYLIKPELDRYYNYMDWLEDHPIED